MRIIMLSGAPTPILTVLLKKGPWVGEGVINVPVLGEVEVELEVHRIPVFPDIKASVECRA